MKSFINAFLFIGITYLFLESFIFIHHEVEEAKYIELGKKYHSLCHFPMGEGVLIDSDWVLTAGNVGNDLKKDLHDGFKPKATIEAGDYEIESVTVHPDFNPTGNDIALVKLKTPVINVTPAKLYTQNSESGKLITIVGLKDAGDGISGPAHWDKIIRGVTNKVDGADDQWLWLDFDGPGSPGGTDMEGISEPGEKGGPAYIDEGNTHYVAGISSHQDDNGHKKGTYGVIEYYTRVSSYAAWIQDVMNRN
ncbi:MAG TPA: trypsin-like serine protease [Chitinophagales bacterium]|nr:trypsin-like serine protease [Chitinophagales bacterium]